MVKLTIICLGNKMPNWVNEAVTIFSKRLKEFCQVQLIEIPLQKRGKVHSFKTIQDKEAENMIKHIPNGSYVIALDINGTAMTSEQLAARVCQLQQTKPHWCLLIGGPEGIPNPVMDLVHENWSLSNLTLSHPIARIVLFESLYRSWTILSDHPYHK
jgi:23S rRNA (pseudouridine1915-N3)-methyltransferase